MTGNSWLLIVGVLSLYRGWAIAIFVFSGRRGSFSDGS